MLEQEVATVAVLRKNAEANAGAQMEVAAVLQDLHFERIEHLRRNLDGVFAADQADTRS